MRSTNALIMGWLLCAVSCGGSSGPPSGSLPAGEFEAGFAEAICNHLVGCGAYAEPASCLQLTAVITGNLAHAIDAGRITYDDVQGAACIDDLLARSCDVTSRDLRVIPASCRAALAGTLAEGADCFDSAECSSGVCGFSSCETSCCLGTCASGRAAVGQSCFNLPCGDDAFCDAAAVCRNLLPAGALCQTSEQCSYGMACLGSNGVCADVPNLGEACPDRACAELGAGCDAGSNTCVRYGGLAESCGAVPCQLPLSCNSVCETPPALGQSCTFFCEPGTFCGSLGQCEPVRQDGMSCDLFLDCASSYCDERGLCAAPPVCD
jgi:hypothetical protein